MVLIKGELMAIQFNTYTDNGPWNRTPHGLIIGDNYETITRTIQEALSKESLEKDLEGNKESQGIIDRALAHIKAVVTDESGDTSNFIDNTAPNDTSVGGMDCINPHHQFGVDDDIRYPAMMTNKQAGVGLGRVYHETYFLNQKNIYLSFGVPQFYGIRDFMATAVDPDQSRIQNNATMEIFQKSRKMILKKALSFNMSFVGMTFIGNVGELLRKTAGTKKINKYYGLKPAMPIYYRMVNTIMSIMAVNMGLYADADTEEEIRSKDQTAFTKGYPPFLTDGPDLYAMLNKRRRKITSDENPKTTDSLIDKIKTIFPPGKNESINKFLAVMDNLITNVDAMSHNLHRHVAFRLESGASPSESVNNQTGQSELASTLNQKASSARDKLFTFKSALADAGMIQNTVKKITETVSKMTEATSLEAVGVILTGNGYIDIPEVWKGSSFTKSVSFDLQLRAKAGDKVSIFQSIYIPLAMLLAAGTPRGIGANAYTQPFLLEAYSAGLYSVPLGIIESISIKRGASEFGWTHTDLPTAIDVTVNIKDLTPVLFMSLLNINEKSVIDQSLEANTGMIDYLNTLSGLSLADRTHKFLRLRRLRRTMQAIARTVVFNPSVFHHELSNTPIARIVAALQFKPYFTPEN